MASSKGNITGLHFALMFFVMLSLVLGVLWYISFREGSEARLALDKQKKEADAQRTVALNRDREIGDLKRLLGPNVESVGNFDNPEPNTLIHTLRSEMQKTGAQLQPGQPETFLVHFQELRNQVNKLMAERNQLDADLKNRNETIAALRKEYQDEVDVTHDALAQTQQDMQNVQKEKDETVNALRQDIATLQNNYRQVQAERDQLQQEFAKATDEHKQRESNLIAQIDRLRDEKFERENMAFEVADGHIRWVDHKQGVVWINLGEADGLSKRTTFSVYQKNAARVGGRDADIKGKIEVTQIRGPHLAEARVVDEDPYRPIAPDDAIYTPVWSANESQNFAIVGRIDFEGDGHSDREALHNMIASSNGKVVAEVDDEGNFTGSDLNERTKFVIVGDLGDLSEIPGEDEPARAAVENMQEQHKLLTTQAREHGVRVVSLHDFLNWIGYKNKKRVWRPGEQGSWTLSAGSRSTGVNETIGNQSSSTGTTSGLYSRKTRLGPAASNGQDKTEQFRNGSSY
jgi:hypothetical protein